MGRSKEFEPQEALRAALDLFWERGYEATSMSDLVERLGIGRASIYGTFGSKQELFLQALDRYVSETDARVIERLSRPGRALSAVRELVEWYVEETERDDGRGCLVVNAAVELLPANEAVARRVEASWRTLEVALATALSRARVEGDLRPDADPLSLARFLVVVLQGLRVVGKGADRHRGRDAARQALAVLVGQYN
ncbi:TetR/AcrR family transcriptional regulator [Planosporangium thailandense]|uniref:TetR/AcrR family transcriptional regulator n=1 Tax=Planosporangium thailandense TaxID=765197 RepID=A0ABX0XZN5_9ACTN|nr:TetR/AcrR family transcriptional regulator [Planosporangium thailandense]NJC70704.1 TetR/AcrR family transcriptional regulator [Planosporangium thailandense]